MKECDMVYEPASPFTCTRLNNLIGQIRIFAKNFLFSKTISNTFKGFFHSFGCFWILWFAEIG